MDKKNLIIGGVLIVILALYLLYNSKKCVFCGGVSGVQSVTPYAGGGLTMPGAPAAFSFQSGSTPGVFTPQLDPFVMPTMGNITINMPPPPVYNIPAAIIMGSSCGSCTTDATTGKVL